MSTTQETREIDGITFTVTQMPAMKAVTLLTFIGKRLGPALARAVSSAQQALGANMTQEDVVVVAEGVGGLLNALEESDAERLLRDMVFDKTVMQFDGKGAHVKRDTFDALFQGKVGTVYKLIAFAFEVNYADFLDALRTKVRASVLMKKASSSTSPMTSATSGPVTDCG